MSGLIGSAEASKIQLLQLEQSGLPPGPRLWLKLPLALAHSGVIEQTRLDKARVGLVTSGIGEIKGWTRNNLVMEQMIWETESFNYQPQYWIQRTYPPQSHLRLTDCYLRRYYLAVLGLGPLCHVCNYHPLSVRLWNILLGGDCDYKHTLLQRTIVHHGGNNHFSAYGPAIHPCIGLPLGEWPSQWTLHNADNRAKYKRSFTSFKWS